MYKNLKAEMLRQDVSATKIANFLGLSKDSVIRKVNGTINMSLREAIKIKSLFKERNAMEYLFEEKEG